MKILRAVFELPAKQHCQSSPFTPKLTQIGRQCCLASSSKISPRILIFSIAMSADYSFYVKSIFWVYISVLARVSPSFFSVYGPAFAPAFLVHDLIDREMSPLLLLGRTSNRKPEKNKYNKKTEMLREQTKKNNDIVTV